SGAADQALRIRQHDRVVPRALHHKWQFELIGAGRGDQRGNPFEIEIARWHRRLANDGQTNRWADNAHVVNGDQTLVDFEVYGELIEWRAAAAECAAPGEWAPFEPAQQ